jgi:hypothetical protein
VGKDFDELMAKYKAGERERNVRVAKGFGVADPDAILTPTPRPPRSGRACRRASATTRTSSPRRSGARSTSSSIPRN